MLSELQSDHDTSMKGVHVRLIVIISTILLSVQMSFAAPISYDIDKDASVVGFTYRFGPEIITGKFNDYDADLRIDFDRVKNSTVNVRLDTTRATAGFPFATQALRSKKILNVDNFPNITFQSTSITGDGNTATINGNVTVRGITKPLTLTAKLFRAVGTTADERDSLTLKITGQIDRTEFGATGYAKEVGDILRIAIDAKIQAQ
ncbi:polyisoprenoid-binding protein [Amylibacter ulvae]|uniref:Polyisoprenoid-binding protein n=1 Tax=Paramylibacter ulvae TaxID=1651968 RepID=A0ABQ3D7X3_9RHOB|nr:YceI family protein [Amylibacter ulvae]GHA54202.1 polyisoprenoid-binding protein [Amylibacter ulvae]